MKDFDIEMSDIENFYSNLNMEDLTYADYKHVKKVWKYFKIKNLGKYQDSYVQSNTLLFADVFEHIQNKCIEKDDLDPAHFYQHQD